MSDLVHRKRNPSARVVAMIEEATGGEVRARDLIKPEAA